MIMRKLFTLLSILFVGGVFAQSLTDVTPNHKVYYDAGVALDDITGAHVEIKNNSSTTNSYKVRWNGYTDSLCSVNYFCWDLCYTPGKLVSDDGMNIAAGSVSTLFSPHIYSKGGGVEGICTVSYTFFNESDLNDTLQVIVEFESSNSISIDDNEPTISAVYPNPASDFVNVNLENPNKGQFQIMNVLGQVVKTKDITEATNNLSIDISELESGVYFYSLIVKGQAVETKRLVVSK